MQPSMGVLAGPSFTHLIVHIDHQREWDSSSPPGKSQRSGSSHSVRHWYIHQKRAQNGLKEKRIVHEHVGHSLLKQRSHSRLANHQVGPLHHNDTDKVGRVTHTQSLHTRARLHREQRSLSNFAAILIHSTILNSARFVLGVVHIAKWWRDIVIVSVKFAKVFFKACTARIQDEVATIDRVIRASRHLGKHGACVQIVFRHPVRRFKLLPRESTVTLQHVHGQVEFHIASHFHQVLFRLFRIVLAIVFPRLEVFVAVINNVESVSNVRAIVKVWQIHAGVVKVLAHAPQIVTVA
mmetsp:Transcript_52560/g.87038  ORF Transcript_52560/g.87038 Transcript_52560/m.87038 type:complete len:294 (-) Transcript_52560:282-1163(-)